jgi:hypothetical protein
MMITIKEMRATPGLDQDLAALQDKSLPPDYESEQSET